MSRKDRLDGDNRFLEGLIKLIIALVAGATGFTVTHPITSGVLLFVTIYCVLSCIGIVVGLMIKRNKNSREIEELE